MRRAEGLKTNILLVIVSQTMAVFELTRGYGSVKPHYWNAKRPVLMNAQIVHPARQVHRCA